MSVEETSVRVLCIDDQAVFRDVMREIIASTPGFTQIGEASCGEAAVAAVVELRPDLVLMDIRMPGLDGFEAAQLMAQRRRDLVVILMSADPLDPATRVPQSGGQINLVAKQELCPRTLLDLWHGRRTR